MGAVDATHTTAHNRTSDLNKDLNGADGCSVDWPYKCVDVDDTLTHPAWWQTSSLGLEDGEDDEADKPVWIHVKAVQTTARLTVEVTSSGGAIGSLDVFEYTGPPDWTSPDCPQGLVYQLYREDGESTLGYLQRLLRMTTADHQVSANGGTAEVTLPGDKEWVIVVDGRGGGTALDTLGAPTVDYEITSDVGDFSYVYLPAPVNPPWVDVNSWFLNILNTTCTDPVIEPPPTSSATPPELAAELEDLLGAHLEG